MYITQHYIEKGIGEPLIMLHGNGEDLTYFSHQMKAFSSYYRVIAVDTRGHGLSLRGDAPFKIDQFAEDLYHFMISQQISVSHLLGFSDGGNIALTFALKHPQMVKTLILNGANLDPSGIKKKVQIPIVINYYLLGLLKHISKKSLLKSELLGLMVNEPDISPEELRGLSIPTLVIVGKNDMIRRNHSQLIYRSLPQAEWAEIDGDHFIAFKNPIEFNARVLQFISKYEK